MKPMRLMPRRTIAISVTVFLVIAFVAYHILSNFATRNQQEIHIPNTVASDSVSTLHVQNYEQYNVENPRDTVPLSSKVNPHNYNLLLNPARLCSDRSVIELVICLPISRADFEGRRVISETWGSYAYYKNNNAVLLFFIGIGDADEPAGIEEMIQSEYQVYQNIVQEDYVDSYRNLSLKSISVLKWVTEKCPHAAFVMKADVDVYINIPRLVMWLREQRKLSNNFITGYQFIDTGPFRNKSSKWYTPKSEYAKNIYPPYTSGTAYAMPMATARRLYMAALETPLFWLEDVYITGLCASRAGVKIVNCTMMTIQKPEASGCEFRNRISAHRYSLEEIMKIQKELYDPKMTCL